MTSSAFGSGDFWSFSLLSKLPIDLYPDIDTNTIMVMTAYPGASASDIENNVTRPLENHFECGEQPETYHLPFFRKYVIDYAGVRSSVTILTF